MSYCLRKLWNPWTIKILACSAVGFSYPASGLFQRKGVSMSHSLASLLGTSASLVSPSFTRQLLPFRLFLTSQASLSAFDRSASVAPTSDPLLQVVSFAAGLKLSKADGSFPQKLLMSFYS